LTSSLAIIMDLFIVSFSKIVFYIPLMDAHV
jgi:hypothetical protein